MSLPKEDGGPTALRALGMMTMFKAISLSTATLIYSKYKATAEPRVSSLGDLGYVYLSAVVLGNAPAALWAVSQQHRHLLGLPRPDQALYKVCEFVFSGEHKQPFENLLKYLFYSLWPCVCVGVLSTCQDTNFGQPCFLFLSSTSL